MQIYKLYYNAPLKCRWPVKVISYKLANRLLAKLAKKVKPNEFNIYIYDPKVIKPQEIKLEIIFIIFS